MHNLDKLHWCVMEACAFLSIMRNFGYIWLSEMRIFVGWFLHIGTEITLKISYLWCFLFSFCRGYIWIKRRHYSAGKTFLHMFHDTTLHETELCTFWTIEAFITGRFSFFFIKMLEFGQSSITLHPLLVLGPVYTELWTTPKPCYLACIAFLMYIHTDVEYYMT